jgi:hypothetical protein
MTRRAAIAKMIQAKKKSFCIACFYLLIASFFVLPLSHAFADPAPENVNGEGNHTHQPPSSSDAPALPLPIKGTTSTADYNVTTNTIRGNISNIRPSENINLSNIPNPKRQIPNKRVASISFSWDHPVAAAIFRRAGYIWVLFDRHGDFDQDLLKEMGKNIVYDVRIIPHNNATAVRILAKEGYNASLRREGLLWIVDLMQKPQTPEQKLDILPQFNSPIGPHIFIPTKDAGTLIGLVDPEIGDGLFIIPFMKIGVGVHPKYSFPEVDILPSSQGLVIKKKKSNIEINVSQNGIEIFSKKGLKLSQNLSNYQKNSTGTVMGGSEYFALFRWQRNSTKGFAAERSVLMQELYDAKKNHNIQEARLNLAKFYVANSYASEALGVLKNIAKTDPSQEQAPEFLAVRAIANFIAGRYEEAVNDLNTEEFADSNAAAFWRAAAESAITEPEKQAYTLSSNGAIIRDYPRKIKTKLALIAANATIAAADDSATQTFIEIADSEDNSINDKVAVKYLTSKWLELTGDYTNAILKWEYIIRKSKNRLYSALSSVAKIKLLLKTNNIEYSEAARELEKLSFSWRGNGFEFDSLGLLAKMYLADGRYSEGLRMLKHIHSNLNNFEAYSKEADEYITKIMSNVFQKLYLDGLALKISPIDSISLFNEFKYLIPKNKEGDEIILRMAGRMVSVDLLSSAAKLLYPQVMFNLRGYEKARIGTRLAIIQLMNHEPKKAYEALVESEYQDISRNLQIQRKHLKARALAGMNMVDQAIELLADDFSIESRLLTTEILWNAKRWADVSIILRGFIKKPIPGEALSDTQAKMILYWATALKLSGKDKVLMRVRYNFLDHMNNTPYRDAFNLITDTNKNDILDPAKISEEIKQVENFNAFIASFTENKEYQVEN